MKKFYLFKNFQVIYGLALVILVPIVVAVNTVSLNRSFRTNIDVQLQRQALALGRAFNVSVQDDLDDLDKLQAQVENMMENQIDITDIKVLDFSVDGFSVIASSNLADKGTVSSSTQSFIAWHQNEAIATLINSLDQKDGRYWLVTMPIHDSDGTRRYLLSMSVSLEVMDVLVKSTLVRSYIFLSLTVLFLILLLAANSRLFEYAVLYRKIKEVDKMKDEFISIASHELRTPLTVIKGYISMLLGDKEVNLSRSVKQSLMTIDSSAERLNILVEDLLNVSRIEQNRMHLEIAMIDPLEVVTEVVSELKIEAESKGLNLKMACREKLPHILADRQKLKQVLINLVGNAIKYTKLGSVTIDCSEEKGFLKITTTDTGVGMTTQERSRLFEKFYRVKNEDTEGVHGTGLGLWIAKQMIERMSGQIYIDSISGVGTQASILLPLKK